MQWNLFLSSTVKDLKRYRREVQKSCQEKANSACQLSEDGWTGGYDNTVDKCQRRINEADAFILLAGYYYGSVPPGSDRSITHIEFDEALHKWGQQQFPPMCVMMPTIGSKAEKQLKKAAAKVLLDLQSANQNFDYREHEKLLNAFHNQLTRPPGIWRTVTWFKDLSELCQWAISNCLIWQGQTPIAAARGEHVSASETLTIQRVTDEQLGQLGRGRQLQEIKSTLAEVTEYPDVPALALIIHGDENAGQSTFLQALCAVKVLSRYSPKQRITSIPAEFGSPALLPSWIAQLLKIPGGGAIKTPRQLAEGIAPELKVHPMYFVLDRIALFAGGVLGFHENFWLPFYQRLHELRAEQQFPHRLLALISDDADDPSSWPDATVEPTPPGGMADYTRLLRIQRLENFQLNDLLVWFEEQDVPDVPPGRLLNLADRALKNSNGVIDGVPIRVFERLRREQFLPEVGEN